MSTLTEEQVIGGFHSLLQDSLAQARGEGLLSDSELGAAEPSVQIAAPSLVLFFAALGSSGTPPSISSPDQSFVLSSQNCPNSFSNAFRLWQECVRPIQGLGSEARHDLALLLCDKAAVSSPLRMDVSRLASDLKGIGLEILQRRTFQLRFQRDLDVALDSGVRPRTSTDSSRSSNGRPRSSFEPPPMYSEGMPTEETKRAYGGMAEREERAREEVQTRAFEYEENLSVIRETLYSAFADAIVDTPSILDLLARGTDYAPRAFFASTCLAILEVSLSRVDSDGVRVVQMGRGSPKFIGINETPAHLRPFLGKLIELSQALQSLSTLDDETAIREASLSDQTTTFSTPRIAKLRDRLAQGVSIDGQGSLREDTREDQELRMLGNAINEMALGMSSLPAFRERQAEAFKVLISVTTF